MNKEEITSCRRIACINSFVAIVAAHGRHFFRYDNRLGMMTMDDSGKVWWRDEFTNKRCLLKGCWPDWGQKIGHGSGLRMLIQGMRDWVLTGKQIRENIFEYWGYDDDIKHVKEAALKIGLLSPREEPMEVG